MSSKKVVTLTIDVEDEYLQSLLDKLTKIADASAARAIRCKPFSAGYERNVAEAGTLDGIVAILRNAAK